MLDRMVRSGGLTTEGVRIARDGASLKVGDGTGPPRPQDLSRALQEHATVVLDDLQEHLPAAAALSRRLHDELPVFAAEPIVIAFVTPPGCYGFAIHFDPMDVVILQVEGVKTWRLWDPPQTLPLRSRPGRPIDYDFVVPLAEVEPRSRVTLMPGDVLYLPRGTPHAASAGAGLSVHLTVAWDTVTWHDAACWLMDGALNGANGESLAQRLRRRAAGAAPDQVLEWATVARNPVRGSLGDRLDELGRRVAWRRGIPRNAGDGELARGLEQAIAAMTAPGQAVTQAPLSPSGPRTASART